MSFVSAEINPAEYTTVSQALRSGEVAILPTETVYGLAARADDAQAVEQIFSIKNRPAHQTFPVCVFSVKRAENLAIIPTLAKTLMEQFWPGPLTLVLPVKDRNNLCPQVIATDGTIALRVPDIEWRPVFDAAGLPPLALTSANISGAPSPLNFDDIDPRVKDGVSAKIDNGPCREGLASTIIRITHEGAQLLREGALKAEDFARFDMNWIAS